MPLTTHWKPTRKKIERNIRGL